jgi:ligand-binding sensor domain-containing protein
MLKLAVAMAFIGLAEGQQYTFRTYGPDQGLNNLGVKQLHQDRQGFLWVSTEGGVFRYDGERFQLFGPAQGLPSSNGVAFGEAPDGTLLVGGKIGLFRKAGERFEPVPMPGAASVSWFSGIQFDGNATTWVGTDTGLMAITRGRDPASFRFRLVPKPPGVEKPGTSGLLVEGGTIWYGCDLQVCRLTDGQVTVFGAKAGLPPSQWKGIRRDGSGDVWVQGRSEVARLRWGAKRCEVQVVPFRDTPATGMPEVDRTGGVIFGTNDGLMIREAGSWLRLDRDSCLHGSVYCTFEDREGSLWIGLLGRGLVCWIGFRQWEAFTSASTGVPSRHWRWPSKPRIKLPVTICSASRSMRLS